MDRLSAAERRALGDRLRLGREWQQLRIRQVAEKMGCSRFAVMNWEAGRDVPRLEIRQPLADLYGLPLEELFAEVFEAVGRPRPPRPPRARPPGRKPARKPAPA